MLPMFHMRAPFSATSPGSGVGPTTEPSVDTSVVPLPPHQVDGGGDCRVEVVAVDQPEHDVEG